MAEYVVTRALQAPPYRAGRAWPVGETVAELSPEQAALVAADARYRLVPVAAPEPKRPVRRAKEG